MRKTKQKELVLNIINCSTNHLTAEEVYIKCKKDLPNMSLGTVYRNLNQLVEIGKIKRIKMHNNIDRFDRLDDHAHFICTKCNKIVDVNIKYLGKLPNIDDALIVDYDMIFKGFCKNCKEE